MSYLQTFAPELTDRMLADFLDVDDSININIHIQSIDQSLKDQDDQEQDFRFG